MTRKPAKYVAQVIRPQFPVFLTLLWYTTDTLLANDQIKLHAERDRVLTSRREERDRAGMESKLDARGFALLFG
jgi:hypothetical protein